MSSDNTLSMILPVKDGRLVWTDSQKAMLANYLRARPAVLVKIGKPVKQRGVKANNYYWGVVLTTIARETGNDVMDLHEVYKEMFIPPKFITLGSREIQVRRTTTDMSVGEFNVYVEKVTAHAASELGIGMPVM